jgi:hypothetical protein
MRERYKVGRIVIQSKVDKIGGDTPLSVEMCALFEQC